MRFWFKIELGGPAELKDNIMLSSSVPKKIRKLYTEAKTCFDVGAYRASVVMLRAAVERTLKDKSLEEIYLTPKQARIMSRITVIGNQAAHGNSISSEAVPTLLGDFGSVVCSVYDAKNS